MVTAAGVVINEGVERFRGAATAYDGDIVSDDDIPTVLAKA